MLQKVAIDVDHVILHEDRDCLQVNPRWLEHLQVPYTVCHTVASHRTSNEYLFTLHGT